MPDIARGGFLGVDVFFVISGYLITSIIIAEAQTSSFSLLGFYERRARRILPALFVVMAACLPFAYLWMLPRQLAEFSESLMAVPLFISNFLFLSQSGYFAQAAELKPLLHTWSLAVEEQFYVFFPLFILLFWRFGRTVIVSTIVVTLLISLLISQWGAHYHQNANFFLIPSRAWELLAGSLCAFWLESRGRGRSNLLSLLGLVLIFGSMALLDRQSPAPGFVSVAPVLGVVLIILFATPDTWAGRLLSGRVVVGVGLISYSAYLWHQPLFAFARIRSFDPPSIGMYILLSGVCLFLAYFTWRFVEKPCRTTRTGTNLLTRPMVFSGAIILSLVFLSFGAAFRYDLLVPKSSYLIADASNIFKDLAKERRDLVRRGQCEAWPVDTWDQQWHGCDPFAQGVKAEGRTPISIAVIGDSHASDLAVGLRKNGFEPFQATGLGCSLRPESMGPYCRAYFEIVRGQLTNSENIQELWMANRYNGAEFSKTQLRDALEFWSQTGIPLVFFTPMPEYPNRNNLVLKEALFEQEYDQTIDRTLSDISKAPYLIPLAKEYSATVVNSEQVFCSLSGDCGFKDALGHYLTTDYGHLSAQGAAVFVATILRQQPEK